MGERDVRAIWSKEVGTLTLWTWSDSLTGLAPTVAHRGNGRRGGEFRCRLRFMVAMG